MNIDTETLLQDLLDSLSKVDGVHPEDVPNIDLYMDQVTTFMDARLASSKRYEEDKILTKTMINNYAKNHLLPPPEKKKYSKEHMLVLIFIYYFKIFSRSMISRRSLSRSRKSIFIQKMVFPSLICIRRFSSWSVLKSEQFGKMW